MNDAVTQVFAVWSEGDAAVEARFAAGTGAFNPLRILVDDTFALPGGYVALSFVAPGFEGLPYIAAASAATFPGIYTPYGNVNLKIDDLFWYSLQTPEVFVGFSGTMNAVGSAPGLVLVPDLPALHGYDFFTAFVAAGPAELGVSPSYLVQVR